ncbi:hypothetical protein WL68_27225 [Burkholderia cepacia]|nr:hypothetical protein APZ15_32990 [Burkholderia cepacia ATCC 25416]KVX46554.1 hypothetical protein WL06_34210 [Burkholderia cepacia]KWD58153.1 hypothetical protein WL68_27225 [Burkholderia cepacia]KWD76064.1 hypothetical protein WL69_24395 [Burkholderia cepacia]
MSHRSRDAIVASGFVNPSHCSEHSVFQYSRVEAIQQMLAIALQHSLDRPVIEKEDCRRLRIGAEVIRWTGAD